MSLNEFLIAKLLQEKQQPTNTMSTNLVTLNQTAQEIASALGTIDLELLQQVHALVTGGNKQDAAAAETETSAS